MTIAAALRNVTVRFGERRALQALSLTLQAGRLCGLVGPNGAGKTTTMRLLVADLSPTEGEVEVLGRRLPAEAVRVRPRIGYMPDSAGLYDELTLEEYLDLFASLYGLRGGRRRTAVEVATEMAGVTGLSRRRLGGLSKGERQRVLLSRTLIHDPELLVLDEPADGLDPRGRVELRELLRLLHERGKTILISSHILSDLEEICTDFVFLDRGRVVFEGARDSLGGSRARIRIECLEPPDAVEAMLSADPDVVIEERVGAGLSVLVGPEPEAAHRLLSRLSSKGLRVVSFARRPDSLEENYLRLTEERR